MSLKELQIKEPCKYLSEICKELTISAIDNTERELNNYVSQNLDKFYDNTLITIQKNADLGKFACRVHYNNIFMKEFSKLEQKQLQCLNLILDMLIEQKFIVAADNNYIDVSWG